MTKSAPSDVDRLDVFDRLGVRPVINAFETMSRVGGTRIRPEVMEAMRRASATFVFLDELQERVGERIAELTRNEGAVVTNGALAGMLLATAACLRQANGTGRRPHALPTGWKKDEVIVQRCQYSAYVPNITQVGAALVDVGYSAQRTPEYLLESAITEATAAVFYTAGRPFETFAIPLERVVAIAHAHDLPVVVDGAALLPPVSNLWRYTEMGADLVVFSGGKGLRGPQDSGVVVGRRDLIAEIQRLNSPNHGLGRALKSSKEDIVGFLVALELAFEEDDASVYDAYLKRAELVRHALAALPGIETWILPDGRQGQPCPRTVIRLLEASGWRRNEFLTALLAGERPILVGELDELEDAFYVTPRSLTNDEAVEVAQRIGALLAERGGGARA